jgi:hypothetical protein
MGKNRITRRHFVKSTVLATSGLSLAGVPLVGLANEKDPFLALKANIRWLDGPVPVLFSGSTFGVPWKKGEVEDAGNLSLHTSGGKAVPVQSWPLAYWPDGSFKWTAHAVPPGTDLSEGYELLPGKPVVSSQVIGISETPNDLKVDTGLMQCSFAKTGTILVGKMVRKGKTIAENGRLVLFTRNSPEVLPGKPIQTGEFSGNISSMAIEQKGPVRVVIKVEGKHLSGNRQWLPFVLRFYFYAGSASMRVLHTIVYDGDENKDFISAMGFRFNVPLEGEAYNRHVRFTGEENGVFAESLQTLTGLRRDPGEGARKAQVAGKMAPAMEVLAPNVAKNMQYVPVFGDYTLAQTGPDGFSIRKRTTEGFGWLQSAYGSRASGTAWLGTPGGGLAVGLRNFWQSHPAQIDIRNAQTSSGEVTLWMWAPDAQPMDLRFYHDGMGQDTYPKQLDALDITYEDYEPGFGRPIGVARTSEMQFWAMEATPSNTELAAIAAHIQAPPQLVATPDYLKEAGAFGGFWDLPSTNNPAAAEIEQQLDFYVDYYKKQVDFHKWYGFWNYGDVMHTYDTDRHTWRYDVGGFAWDNSELSTDIWLWFYFLRTGRADVFRMAEAMTRHTGEVDVHHTGPFAPLGSRHNVYHWGCSAKQMRISTAANRRYYYYLTADERVGDLMHEQVNAFQTLGKIAPGRKLPVGDVQRPAEMEGAVNMSFGTDWGSVAAAWLTEWERTRNKDIYSKLTNSMATIAAQPRGFFTGGAPMDVQTGKFAIDTSKRVSVSHLNASFGLPETCAELLQTIDMPAFKEAWLQYCTLYNATANEQTAALGEPLKKLNLRQSHSRLTAFAALHKKDAALAKRAWAEFKEDKRINRETRKIKGPDVLNPIEESDYVSTNGVAQWSLAAIECLACIGKEL